MLSGNGRVMTWTAFDQPATVERNGQTLIFGYGPEHQRVTQSAPGAMTYYIGLSASAHLEKTVDAVTGLARYEALIHAGGSTVATLYEIEEAGGGGTTTISTMTRYFQADNLGSISVITDEAGQVVERLSYDAWGKRRFTDGTDDPQETITSLTNRGFTQHEHLEEVALVHMNGRLYDAQIGRFLSADIAIQDLTNSQAFNAYSYVLNNPLAYTDPTGFFFGFFKHIVKSIVSAVVHVVEKTIIEPHVAIISKGIEIVQQNQIAQVALAVGLTAVLGPAGGSLAIGTGLLNATQAAVVSGVVVGGITGGPKGAILGGISAGVTYGIGDAFPKDQLLQRVVANAAFRGALAEATGGDFKTAALSAGFSVVAGHYADVATKGDFGAGIAASAAVGGTTALIGGGKFQNGAASGAFTYLASHAGADSRGGEPTLSHSGKGATAFVGGFFDHTINGPAYTAYNDYIQSNPEAGAAYFTWDQGGALASWIDSYGGAVTVSGHSYGGDTAASVVAAGHRVDSLITVDPVSWIRPNYADVAANAGTWTDFNAVGGAGSFVNFIAVIGGDWGSGPQRLATTFKNIDLNHANIDLACMTPGACTK